MSWRPHIPELEDGTRIEDSVPVVDDSSPASGGLLWAHFDGLITPAGMVTLQVPLRVLCPRTIAFPKLCTQEACCPGGYADEMGDGRVPGEFCSQRQMTRITQPVCGLPGSSSAVKSSGYVSTYEKVKVYPEHPHSFFRKAALAMRYR